MGLIHAGLLFLLVCPAYCFQAEGSTWDGMQDPDSELESIERVVGEEVLQAPVFKTQLARSSPVSRSTTPAPVLPAYVIVWAGSDQKDLFKPENGTRPLPKSVKKTLLPSTTPEPNKTGGPHKIEIQCHFDRMYVRVRRTIFKTTDAYQYLKLGTCPVNEGNKAFYYLLYDVKTDCGFKIVNNPGYLSISNVLHYNPRTPVMREMPFHIPLKCKLPRLFHSYNVGFHPRLMGGTVYKALQPKSSFTISLQDASGKLLSGTKTYALGQRMFFEAKGPDSNVNPGNKRLYLKKCFMTASRDPKSSPKYTVIDNLGCMTDSKLIQQSRFLTSDSKMVVKFSVGSLMFKNVASSPSQKVYMHCEISVGPLTPTRSSKSCTYDRVTRRWTELYGDSSVCLCCKFTCSSGQPKAFRSSITSQSWMVDVHTEDGYMEVTSPEDSFSPDDSAFRMSYPSVAEDQDWDDEY
ncbi:zona pellucida sperm-binding protein 3 [Parambassis ranga]|uniref:Zona pellucida sperm-binding protein 3 n=1 Tax=Parambassis ranga TaxID=210632 RepID=A0A6P7IBG1_9TELE|nr:zona pellucida sperm-binding protein 3-like [Parambassis ranga]